VVGAAALGIVSSRLWSDRRQPVWSVQDDLGAYIAQWRQAQRSPSAASTMRPVPAEPAPAAPVTAEPVTVTAERQPVTVPAPPAAEEVHHAPIAVGAETPGRPQERPGPVAKQPPPPSNGVMATATVAGEPPKLQQQPVTASSSRQGAEQVAVAPQAAVRAQDAVRPPTEQTAAGTAAPLSPALIAMLSRRGNEMLALGDFASARLLFARAAQAGDVNAMVALARMYDQASSDPRDVPRLADRDAAMHWYRLAAAAGSAEAATLLHQIEQRSVK
jgi:hypothetical protein